MSGFNATTFQRDAWLQEAQSTLVNNTWFADGAGLLVQHDEAECQSGPNLTFPIIYTQTDNTEVMPGYDAPMPASGSEGGSYFYFTKTPYHGTAQTYRMLQQFEKGFGNAVPGSSMTSDDTAKGLVLDQLRARISSAYVSELEAQIDEANTFGDGSLTRATYDLVSYEDDDGGYLTLRKMELLIDALCSSTFGDMTDPATQLDICMHRTQARIFSRAGAANVGATFDEANFQMITSAQDGSPIDAGRLSRTKTFEGVNIRIVPITNTVVLGLRRGTNHIYNWWALNVEDKSSGIMAAQKAWYFIIGGNVVCLKPKWNGKISGLST
jgi:hypothetical protein